MISREVILSHYDQFYFQADNSIVEDRVIFEVFKGPHLVFQHEVKIVTEIKQPINFIA